MSTALRIIHSDNNLVELAAELGIALTRAEQFVLSPAGSTAIRDMVEEELVRKVGGLVVGIFKNLGIHSEPEESDAYQFLRTLRHRYSHLTIQEVQRAFEAYIYHDLDTFLPQDKNGRPLQHFQKFSMTFYVEVLEAYMKLRGSAKHGLLKKADTVLLLQEAAAADPYDARCAMLEALRDVVVEVSKGNEPLYALTKAAEEACQDVRLLPEVIEVEPEDYLRAKESLTRNRGRSVARAIDKAMEEGVLTSDMEARSRTYATRRLLRMESMAIGPERVVERFDWLINRYRKQQQHEQGDK